LLLLLLVAPACLAKAGQLRRRELVGSLVTLA
jgi:hypothetical protein